VLNEEKKIRGGGESDKRKRGALRGWMKAELRVLLKPHKKKSSESKGGFGEEKEAACL